MTAASSVFAGRRKTIGLIAVEVAGPLAVFYGLRGAGAGQLPALLAGGVLPATRAVHGIVTKRRVSGVALFVLATMSLTVAMSFVTGSPRVLLVRNAWGTAALAMWMLLTLLRAHPFLYEARTFMPPDQQASWDAGWRRFPAFRQLLRRLTAIWGAAFAADAAIRVLMALTLPIDLVPALDDGLLVVTLAFLVATQRLYGGRHLRKHGLGRRGAEIYRLSDEAHP
ncbi:VC0807 family protein [Nonomuraea fuscirosea]|uniref:VC0807 family protein n=1 Tax=Nonomuraea fuscirosea TaxID=1291556 RepID=UPI00341E3791